ncbi:MAG: AMP-binding protein [Polyangiaceae bacterium]|nr:AMP-binding protein [Polyangiaceae bacterium]
MNDTDRDASDTGALADLTSVAEIVTDRLPRYDRRPAIRIDDGQRYVTVGYDEYLTSVQRMLAYFRAQRAEQCVVATFVKNRVEWDMTALAALTTANVLFPLDTTMSDEELRHLLRLSPPEYVVVSLAQRARMQSLLARLGLRPTVLLADVLRVFEDVGAPPLADLAPNEVPMSSLPAPGAGPIAPSSRLDNPDTVLARYCTSGTTGMPKVVLITHGNIVAQLREAQGIVKLRRNEDLLNIGLYTHIATLLEFLVAKSLGFAVTYFTREADEHGVLEQELGKLTRQGVRIKGLMAVPKFWIFLMKEVLEELKNKPSLRSLYHYLTGIEKHAKLRDIGTVDTAKLLAVRRRFRNQMGGYFSYGVSSSTKIDPGVVEIFAKLGVTVIDIYGATEAAGIIARNRLNESRRGSCGRLSRWLETRLEGPRRIPGIEGVVGKLQIRGPVVCAGYVGEPAGNHLDGDGFYSTGDLVTVDDAGYVYLVGREKELLPWDDGSYVDPMHVSNLLVRSIYVKDALVTRLGDDPYLSVFLLPDYPRVLADPEFKQRVALGLTPEQALWPLLGEAVAYAQSLANITPRLGTRRIYLLTRKLSRTPTHKIKLAHELGHLDLTSYLEDATERSASRDPRGSPPRNRGADHPVPARSHDPAF